MRGLKKWIHRMKNTGPSEILVGFLGYWVFEYCLWAVNESSARPSCLRVDPKSCGPMKCWSAPESLNTCNCNQRAPESPFPELTAWRVVWSITFSKDKCNFLGYVSVIEFDFLNSRHDRSTLIRSHLRSELSSRDIYFFPLPIEDPDVTMLLK